MNAIQLPVAFKEQLDMAFLIPDRLLEFPFALEQLFNVCLFRCKHTVNLTFHGETFLIHLTIKEAACGIIHKAL